MYSETKTILVTGGAGFIGTNFIRYVLTERPGWKIINLDWAESVRSGEYRKWIEQNYGNRRQSPEWIQY
jgi:dTDP-glucose 4,6-dehydratase